MIFKKILTIWLVACTAQIVIACCFTGDCCDCGESVSKNYSNKSITVNNLDNSGDKPIVTNSTEVNRNAYGIKVNLLRELVASHKNVTPTLIQSAYALDCDCPSELAIFPKESIVSFKIYSTYDFDVNHPANSDVSEFFKVQNNNTYYTINEYLNLLNSSGNYGNPAWTLYDEDDLEFEIVLLLMTPPKLNISNKFRIQMTLSDGRIFENETNEIDFI